MLPPLPKSNGSSSGTPILIQLMLSICPSSSSITNSILPTYTIDVNNDDERIENWLHNEFKSPPLSSYPLLCIYNPTTSTLTPLLTQPPSKYLTLEYLRTNKQTKEIKPQIRIYVTGGSR